MTDRSQTDGDRTDETRAEWRPTRRSLLEVGAATGALAGLGSLALGQQQETYRFGGRIEAWMGRAPDAIADQENPTLELAAGTEYEVVWENLDGAPHNFTIQDADGNEIVSTETMSEEGATRSLTFTATQEMARYVCTVHPTTMVGDVEVSGTTTATPGAGTGTESGTGTAGGAGFFEAGTEVGVREVANGPLTAPTDHATGPEDDPRSFVSDQTGQVYVLTEDGLRDEPFVDISDRMVTLGEFNGSYAGEDQVYDERGLTGVDFHPNFAENGRFYLHYSAPPNEETPEGWDHVEVVSEFTASDDGESGDPDSEQQLLTIQHPQFNHDAGPMAFGPDGYLYVPMGDGGGADDDMYGHVDDWYDRNAGGNGQDVSENLLGNVLRIDVDASGGDTPYGIPDDNPFVDEPDALDEIWAYGFRNPYGISFDSGGNCFVTDAGQNLWEEADVVEAGGNYGWNVKEGTHCFSTERPSDISAITDCPEMEPDEAPYDGSPFVDPVVEYPHVYQGTPVGVVIVGGHRYENDTVPGLNGKYVYGEYNQPTGSDPNGRILTATVPDDFDEQGTGTGTGTETGTEAGTETGAGTEAGTGTAAGTGTGTGTDTDTSTPLPGETVTAENPPEIGPDDIPRDELWEMEELQVQGEFSWYVRAFGQSPDGEIYVLVSKNGVPKGGSGAVLQIVPPGEGDTATDTGTSAETGTSAGTETNTGAETDTETGTSAEPATSTGTESSG
ncbi:MAG: PQQ-dependent sugar dehydrogenase [Halosimplex sp.]